MSAGDEAPTSSSRDALDALVAEAKEHLDVRPPGARSETNVAGRIGGPSPLVSRKKDALGDLDWSRLESRLMASIEEEKPPFVREVEDARARRGRSREVALRAGALVLAAAAAVALFVRRDRDVALVDAAASGEAALGVSASALRSTEGAGQVRIGGVVATPGYVVRAADVVEVEAARAVFERPRKVTWLLEQDGAAQDAPGSGHGPTARARVKSAGESLVLGLEHGVIEAQVVPVASGEAFAVDIATERSLVRVAVHGTHLRVAREGNRVVVDLTEGVVSIGVPPRTGVTYGTTVSAPAHVELDATDLGTLRVDHGPAAVRAAIPLGYHETTAALPRPDTAAAPIQAAQPETVASAAPPKAARPEGTSAAPKPEAPKAALPPRDAIAVAVRECAASRSRSGDVHVTVSSNLRLRVSAGGVVESAQFSPPLLPEIQSCAAQTIYKTKLEETGLVTIPIEFSY